MFKREICANVLFHISPAIRNIEIVGMGSIPTQEGIFSEALISLLSDNGLQSLFLRHNCNL